MCTNNNKKHTGSPPRPFYAFWQFFLEKGMSHCNNCSTKKYVESCFWLKKPVKACKRQSSSGKAGGTCQLLITILILNMMTLLILNIKWLKSIILQNCCHNDMTIWSYELWSSNDWWYPHCIVIASSHHHS